MCGCDNIHLDYMLAGLAYGSMRALLNSLQQDLPMTPALGGFCPVINFSNLPLVTTLTPKG
jgi:hypothetical protein